MIYECFARFRKPSFGSPCNLSRQRGGWGQVRTLCDEPRERRRLQSTRPCPGKPPVIVPEATMCSFSRNVSSSSLLFLHRLFLTRSMPERISSRAVVFFSRRRELLFLVFSGLFPELFIETGKNVLFQFHSPNSCQDMSRAFIDVIKIDFKSLFSFHITPTPTSRDFYSSFSYLNSSDKSDVTCLC